MSLETSATQPALPTLDAFPLKAFDTIRFGDTDKLGHVNNAVFSTYLETGNAQLLVAPGRSVAPEGLTFVIVRQVLDYRAEILWPGTVDIGTRVSSIGRSSVNVVQALFQNGRCVATAESVLVLFDPATRRPAMLPPESRAILEAHT